METINDRMEMLVNQKFDGNKAAFAKTIDLPPTSISSYLGNKRRSKPSVDMIAKIVQTMDVEAQWLLTGDGPMLKDERAQMIPTTDGSGIPLLPVEAMAGHLTGEQEFNMAECQRYHIPMFAKADYLIAVRGDSMSPTFHSGDLVACRNLPLTDIFFQWGKVYVVDTDQGALIKRIKKGTTADRITLVSDNENYSPFEIPLTGIYHVALVVGSLHVE